MDAGREVVEHAIASALSAGAYSADVALSTGESFEARVRGEEIDFVKQARERGLAVRVFHGGRGGLSTALTRTSDLALDVVAGVARDAVSLARATAPDPCNGLPDGGFAGELPDLELFDPRDRPFDTEGRIRAARDAELAAREVDPRIGASDGSNVGSAWSEVLYGNSSGFLGGYTGARHSLFAESLARSADGKMQRDVWLTSARGACPRAKRR